MKKNKTLRELFSFNGFVAKNKLIGKFGDPKARIIDLVRKKKQQHVQSVIHNTRIFTIENCIFLVIVMRKVIEFMCDTKEDVCSVKNAKRYAWKH